MALGKDIKLSYNNRISRPSSKYINTNTSVNNTYQFLDTSKTICILIGQVLCTLKEDLT